MYTSPQKPWRSQVSLRSRTCMYYASFLSSWRWLYWSRTIRWCGLANQLGHVKSWVRHIDTQLDCICSPMTCFTCILSDMVHSFEIFHIWCVVRASKMNAMHAPALRLLTTCRKSSYPGSWISDTMLPAWVLIYYITRYLELRILQESTPPDTL